MSKIDPREFALAVVSGNPVTGDSANEKAEKALDLYLAALKIAELENAMEKDQTGKRYLGI